ncbi:MAG TPA: RIP metalloprotease RseP [Tenuifilaceae bacterium]|nr:RIP metalloprotease RseP [Tenuifilaceae bacterium]HPE18564.1 RIP metalloprotease RseP [Tenuifilaceae bacterium]HPJ46117.1 RIP metalloprotease RseP [Tenuifilaceae bacterium]HPQ34398.1 RIP metalloprotease RseP [Tenuifilaceae bacterium]HRX67794.1 RIP metalloprotease RseP [Tenuifilaceae bacterium]
MEILTKILQFILSISILVVLHEMGHFVFAKIFKTRVEKFYLFFDPWFSLFKVKKGETEYGVGWLPLGGYVKISGMIDESMDTKQMNQPPQPYEYRSKPAWQRFFIITGGVLVNFILAMLIFIAVLYTWGESYLPTNSLKYGVTVDSLAYEMGFRNGDKILLVGGEEVEAFHQIVPQMVFDEAQAVTVERFGSRVDVPVEERYISQILKSPYLFQPRFPMEIGEVVKESAASKAGIEVGDQLLAINGFSAKYFDEFKDSATFYAGKNFNITMNRKGVPVNIEINVPQSGVIGVYSIQDMSKFFEIKVLEYSFLEAIPAGIERGFSTISNYLKQLKMIFSPSTKAYESVGGFITIGKIFPGVWDWQAFWGLTAFLSIMLAILNILPIPALDGGHMIFLVYEMVSGRKPSDKFMEYAQIVGMMFILALVIFANGNDIVKLFN